MPARNLHATVMETTYRGTENMACEPAAIKVTIFGLFLENKSPHLYTSTVNANKNTGKIIYFFGLSLFDLKSNLHMTTNNLRLFANLVKTVL